MISSRTNRPWPQRGCAVTRLGCQACWAVARLPSGRGMGGGLGDAHLLRDARDRPRRAGLGGCFSRAPGDDPDPSGAPAFSEFRPSEPIPPPTPRGIPQASPGPTDSRLPPGPARGGRSAYRPGHGERRRIWKPSVNEAWPKRKWTRAPEKMEQGEPDTHLHAGPDKSPKKETRNPNQSRTQKHHEEELALGKTETRTGHPHEPEDAPAAPGLTNRQPSGHTKCLFLPPDPVPWAPPGTYPSQTAARESGRREAGQGGGAKVTPVTSPGRLRPRRPGAAPRRVQSRGP
ncbi:ESX-1 secretion-associated protein EspI-like [Sorex araneus]|uniref:ESX-1 secretion-associated protein EspI-like n=1 Tax=Sorex araneus TaxID=42254 RepID=UPI0024334048|nr:ESX-1 secretion-associated protein EspI-like [Sorex araneus]